MRPAAVGKAFGFEQSVQATEHGFDIHVSSGEQRFEREPGSRRLRMEWKVHPLDVEIEFVAQLLQAGGAEVAPRAHEVCKYLKTHQCWSG